jgi:hypothetical protein
VGVAKGALPLDPPKGAKHRKQQFGTAADVAAFVARVRSEGERRRSRQAGRRVIGAVDRYPPVSCEDGLAQGQST